MIFKRPPKRILILVIPGSGNTMDPANHHMQIRAMRALDHKFPATDAFTHKFFLLMGHKARGMQESEARSTLRYMMAGAKVHHLHPPVHSWALDERPKSMSQTIMALGGWLKELEDARCEEARVYFIINRLHARRVRLMIHDLLPAYADDVLVLETPNDYDDTTRFNARAAARLRKQRLKRELMAWVKYWADPYDRYLNQMRIHRQKNRVWLLLREGVRAVGLLLKRFRNGPPQPDDIGQSLLRDPTPGLLNQPAVEKAFSDAHL